MKKDYKTLSREEVITALKPMLENGSMYIRDDGKITRKTKLAFNTPWIHIKGARLRNCGLWHMYHQIFGFIPSQCQECWKVVARPRTLVELDKLLEIQKLLDLPSKCGIEKRETVCGLYGGYFYNDSLEEGKKCWRLVRENVSHNISPDVPVILKRGCTEFEIDEKRGFVPSNTWEVSEAQREKEKILNDIIDQSIFGASQPEHLKQYVFRSWIHWAYQNGDLTYLNYTGGEPLFQAYITYHNDLLQEMNNAKKGKETNRFKSTDRDIKESNRNKIKKE